MQSKQENMDPELAMREACAAHGEFKRKADGTMEFEDYCALRAIIYRQTQRAVADKKKGLEAKKLQAYKDNDDTSFVRNWREIRHITEQAGVSMMQKACQHIEITSIKYGQTSRTYMADKAKAQQITVAESAAV